MPRARKQEELSTAGRRQAALANPELERASAKRMGAKVTEMDTSHVPMLSRPQAVLEVNREAAKAVMDNYDA
jgi:hypothetical protein